LIDQNGEVSTSRDEPNEVEHIDSRADRKAVWIIGIVFFTLFLLLTPLGLFSKIIPKEWHTGYFAITQIDSADDTGYYSYLRSAFFDGDIDFFNEKKYYYSNKITLTGYSHNHWAIGSAILWTPFFMVGHFVAHIYKWLGYPMDIDGYSFPYLVFTAIGAMFYVLWGLYLGYRLLRKFFSPFASLLSTITVFLSTPLPYYTFIQPHLSHSGEFFLVVLFITLFFSWRENGKKPLEGFMLGVASGMLFNIRNNSFIFFSIFLVELFWGKKSDENAMPRNNNLRNTWNIIKSVGAGFFLTSLPQFLAWYIIFGKPFPPTELYGSLFTNFINPHLLFFAVPKLFFSPDWGLALTQPVWLLGICGLLLFIRRDVILSFALLSAVILSLAVSAAYNSVFISQFAFGYRLLVSCNFLISVGFANLIDLYRKPPKYFWIFISCVFFFMNYFLLISCQIVVAWNNPQYALDTYRNAACILNNAPYLLVRSTSFFRLLSLGPALFSNFRGWFAMFFLPMFFFAGIIITIWIYLSRSKKSQLKSGFLPYTTALIAVILICLNLIAVRLNHVKSPIEVQKRFEEGIIESLNQGNIEMASENLDTAAIYGFTSPDFLEKLRGMIFPSKIWTLMDHRRAELSSLYYRIFGNLHFIYCVPHFNDMSIETDIAFVYGNLKNLLCIYFSPKGKGIIISGWYKWRLDL